ncbi:hypothetical protein [Natronobacterium gregoryi]|uniref:Uncharacterized protein n=2 Tax=Natronobacterium gregoryi TaxID=44930 RepID=L0AJA4_NATGS|nr:hypothetical protein [Natronobacterium gregoryi]AFZ73983.1 hypothetical protein Natgr_2839 [Natronobacterium gregoryi SP2]ELY68825.1 hypothetical protein C490_08936 [Natronobacterium gregoryi SP2]PLK18291.1 hypothetical protein CYV19_18365 [Natronobacterium gregoryi SP2]SFJ72374.1 hypothetical protein SAMN05443661_1662 [Natronobacterium gregoryi]
MALEQSAGESKTVWSGTVPTAWDLRVVGLVVAVAALAASVNVPYGGVPVAAVAFLVLTAGGFVVHLLGERQLRRLTDGLVERWADAGGTIEDVTRSAEGSRTEWTVHTPDGDVTIGGVPVIPMTQLSIEWQGVSDTMDAGEAEENLDRLAASLYEEIFEIQASPDQTHHSPNSAS